jgi:predicted nucleic acid-binding protein
MLDTNICIYTMKQKPPGVFQSLRKLSPESVCISAITEADIL